MTVDDESAPSVDPCNHPAYRAWTRSRPGSPPPTGIEALKPSSAGTVAVAERRVRSGKTSIFRLHGVAPRGRSVVAKLAPRPVVALERVIYEDVLSGLPLASVELLDVVPANDAPPMDWLFLSDEGDQEWNELDPFDQQLYAVWLARLHGYTAASDDLRDLPARGADHYLSSVRNARVRLGAALHAIDGRKPTAARELGDLDRLLSRVEATWGTVEIATEPLPHTLVHGDLQPKNLRIRRTGTSLDLIALDWEMAGYGLPAADLDKQCLAEASSLRARYGTTIRAWVPALTDDEVLRLVHLGMVFQVLCAIDWASQWLEYPSKCDKALRYLSVHRATLAEVTARSELSEVFTWS